MVSQVNGSTMPIKLDDFYNQDNMLKQSDIGYDLIRIKKACVLLEKPQ